MTGAVVADAVVVEGPAVADSRHTGFPVRLRNFTGPFDLLLQLISSRRLDVTEVALHQVTDDFLAHVKLLSHDRSLDETTEFLVVAATLLDLKAARLLPAGDDGVEDLADLALLEARDLLFARLLQHRAYQQVASLFTELEAGALRRYPRSVSLEERFAALLPEVLLGVDVAHFADVAAAVFAPAPPPPTVSLTHLHAPRVSVAEQALTVQERLRAAAGWVGFAELVHDCGSTALVVARFLALLELFRRAAVTFEQADALGELRVRWTGPEDAGEEPAPVAEQEWG